MQFFLALPCSTQDFNCIMWDLHGGAGTLDIHNVQPQWLQHSELSCSEVCGILVPRPGIEPASPVLEGGFLTTGSPGKALMALLDPNPGSWVPSIIPCKGFLKLGRPRTNPASDTTLMRCTQYFGIG